MLLFVAALLACVLVVHARRRTQRFEAPGGGVGTVELVVARYDEDVSWLARWIPHAARITVYDKSAAPLASPHPKVRVVALPNVGREAHTYAHHFAERYDDLCDTVVCTQGRYQDHMGDEAFDEMVRSGTRAASQHALDLTWTDTLMDQFGWTEAANNHTQGQPMQSMQPMGMTMGQFFQTYIADDLVPESSVDWWANGVFVVAAKDVRRHPRARYEAIRAVLGSHPNPEAGHAMERLWKALLIRKQVT